MKILKMPDKATEQFDRFVQQRLNEVEVDASLADEMANGMQFPIAVAPAPSQGLLQRYFGGKRKYYSVLLALLFVSGIIITVAINNTGKATNEQTDTGQQANPATNNNTHNNNSGNTNSITGEGAKENAVTTEQGATAGNRQNEAAPVQQANNNSEQAINAGYEPGTTNSRESKHTNNTSAGTTSGNETPVSDAVTVKENNPGTAAKPDSARMAITPAEPKKPQPQKDTIHVIW